MNEDEAIGRTLGPHRTPEFQSYMAALFNDLVWWRGRQLTTGPGWLRGFRSTQTTHPDPPAPCTCTYRVHWTRFALPPTGRRPRHRTVVEGSSFTIDPGCPHHGDRYSYPSGLEYLWERVLTDDSERGHDADPT